MKNVKTAVTAVTASTVATQIVLVAGHDIKAKAAAAELGRSMVALFIANDHSEAEFFAMFGNGKNGKERVAGTLADTVQAHMPKDKEKAKAVAAVLKVRLSEARRLFKAKGTCNPDDANVQAALKRYLTTPAAKPAAAPAETASPVVIADDASLNDIAEAVSVWVAKHGNAGAAGLAAALKDCLPVTVKRTMRKAS